MASYPHFLEPSILTRLKLRTLWGTVFLKFDDKRKVYVWYCKDGERYIADCLHGFPGEEYADCPHHYCSFCKMARSAP